MADVETLIKSRGHQARRIDVPRPGKHPHSDLTGILLLAMSSFGLFVLVLSGILVINLLTAMMASQVRHIGVMKAIGGTRRHIARIYFGQALFLGLAAVIVSIPLGIIGSRALCRYMAMFLNFDINSFAVPWWVYVLVAIVGIAAPLVAAALPVLRGTAVPVRVALSAIIGGVGGLGLMTTMSLNVFERRREMGVMRALGATPRIVWLMVVAEGVVIGALSWAIAGLLAWPISKAIGNLLVRVIFRGGLDFTFEPLGLVIWMVVSISLSALASFLPAWKASRVTVREALAYE